MSDIVPVNPSPRASKRKAFTRFLKKVFTLGRYGRKVKTTPSPIQLDKPLDRPKDAATNFSSTFEDIPPRSESATSDGTINFTVEKVGSDASTSASTRAQAADPPEKEPAGMNQDDLKPASSTEETQMAKTSRKQKPRAETGPGTPTAPESPNQKLPQVRRLKNALPNPRSGAAKEPRRLPRTTHAPSVSSRTTHPGYHKLIYAPGMRLAKQSPESWRGTTTTSLKPKTLITGQNALKAPLQKSFWDKSLKEIAQSVRGTIDQTHSHITNQITQGANAIKAGAVAAAPYVIKGLIYAVPTAAAIGVTAAAAPAALPTVALTMGVSLATNQLGKLMQSKASPKPLPKGR